MKKKKKKKKIMSCSKVWCIENQENENWKDTGTSFTTRIYTSLKSKQMRNKKECMHWVMFLWEKINQSHMIMIDLFIPSLWFSQAKREDSTIWMNKITNCGCKSSSKPLDIKIFRAIMRLKNLLVKENSDELNLESIRKQAKR